MYHDVLEEPRRYPTSLQEAPTREVYGREHFFGKPLSDTTTYESVHKYTFLCCASMVGDVAYQPAMPVGGLCVMPKGVNAFDGYVCNHCNMWLHKQCKAMHYSDTDHRCPWCYMQYDKNPSYQRVNQATSRAWFAYRRENMPLGRQFIPHGLATFAYWKLNQHPRVEYNKKVYELAKQVRYPEEKKEYLS